MYATLVYVHVKPDHVPDFIEAIRENHEASIREPGNLRFDILQSPDDPTRFLAYEAYINEAAAKAHKETAHYLAWRDKVADWMAEPRQGVRYDGLFPQLAGAGASTGSDIRTGAGQGSEEGQSAEPGAAQVPGADRGGRRRW